MKKLIIKIRIKKKQIIYQSANCSQENFYYCDLEIENGENRLSIMSLIAGTNHK